MSQWKSYSMECTECGARHDRIVDKRTWPDEPELCGEPLVGLETYGACEVEFAAICPGVLQPLDAAPLGHSYVRGNSDYAEKQGARLAKRSTAHFKREGRDEAMERQRDVFRGIGLKGAVR